MRYTVIDSQGWDFNSLWELFQSKREAGINAKRALRDALDEFRGDGRPLVTIDPESAEDVGRLAREIVLGCAILSGGGMQHDNLADALREFASPTPPKPDEPTGVGAVVEDAHGDVWVRFKSAEIRPWRINYPGEPEPAPRKFYRDIDAVKVLSEGVPA